MKARHYLTPLLATLLSLGLLLTVAVGTASAHAKVLSATPGIGSTIASAPTTVTVQTAENMNPDPKKSNLFVYGPGGDLISQGNAKIPLNNPKEMSVGIKASGAGAYVVRWITVSADDGDPDEGAFTFTVKAAGAAAATPTTATAATPKTTTESSSPILPAVITGIVALLIGLGAGFGLGRNRASTGVTDAGEKQEEITTKSRQ